MSTPEEKTIANLPVPDASARGTLGAEELAAIMARARADTAQKVVMIGDEQRKQEEREATEREASEAYWQEQRYVRGVDADTAARRGQANVALARSACVTGGATIAGFLLGGPVGAVLGCASGWIGNHLLGGK